MRLFSLDKFVICLLTSVSVVYITWQDHSALFTSIQSAHHHPGQDHLDLWLDKQLQTSNDTQINCTEIINGAHLASKNANLSLVQCGPLDQENCDENYRR